MTLPWWYCFGVYWHCHWSREHGGLSFWLRTPLFAIGWMKHGKRPEVLGYWSGWRIDWIPYRWNLRIEPGICLYRHSWHNWRLVEDVNQ